jgi:hypothetical protein
MKTHPSRYPLFGLLLCLFASFPAPTKAAGEDWKPIDPTHLSLKSATVEKDADAEALFWEVRIDDNPEGDLVFNHYLRVKVFTERGRESQSRIDLEYGKLWGNEIKIKDIEARTIKADGSIVALKKEDIYERTIVKGNGVKYKARSFAMPAVEPGCIIEYRWKEVRVKSDAHNIRLQFQRDIPVQRVEYLIKPMDYPGYAFNSITLHGKPTAWVKEKGGFYSTTMSNMSAMHDEARMPPEDEVKTWMLVYYHKQMVEKIDPQKYWTELAKSFYDRTKSLIKANDEVKQMSDSLVADAKTDDEKLERLFQFCREKIKNSSNDATHLTPEEKEKLKENKKPSDTLKRGIGSGGDIDLLFAALASAAGFDARIVLTSDRSDMFFDKSIPNAYFVAPRIIAVNVSGNWKFFNPGYNYTPYGMLPWQSEGIQALISDPKQPVWVMTPMSSYQKSEIKRDAKLKLSEDGTIEGDIKIEFTGHSAMVRKEDMDDESETEREEGVRNEIKAQMSAAEVSDIKIENVSDHVKPLVVSYRVRFPGYAQRTGKRLFLQPAFFQHGRGAMFATGNRKYPIYFHYPWSEKDQVEFELPKGYALDNADAPAPFTATGISEYTPSLAASTDGTLLIYKRSFYFGNGGAVLYPVEAYSQLKTFFDTLHKQDSHSVALKQKATN